MKTPPPIFPCQRAIPWFAVKLLVIIGLFLLLNLLFPAYGQSNSVPSEPRPHIDPATVQTQFNAWSVVLFGIGAVVWHLILKAWPGIKSVYPCVVANGGIVTIIGRFFYAPSPPGNPAEPTKPTPTKPTP